MVNPLTAILLCLMFYVLSTNILFMNVKINEVDSFRDKFFIVSRFNVFSYGVFS